MDVASVTRVPSLFFFVVPVEVDSKGEREEEEEEKEKEKNHFTQVVLSYAPSLLDPSPFILNPQRRVYFLFPTIFSMTHTLSKVT